MCQFGEKLKKPHSFVILRGLKGIRGNYYSKPFQNYICVGIIQIDFSSENQTIPMNQSEEKWEKPHFEDFLRGLRGLKGIKTFPNNFQIANVKVLSMVTLVPTSRLAGSLDFRPFFSQRNCQNTDLNNQNTQFRGPPKKPDKIPKKIVFSLFKRIKGDQRGLKSIQQFLKFSMCRYYLD